MQTLCPLRRTRLHYVGYDVLMTPDVLSPSWLRHLKYITDAETVNRVEIGSLSESRLYLL
jgi:hypothetical protein